jgi:glycosyltransferase involved in cell wall biosynthesis
MNKKKYRVGIFIPCYNEAAIIAETVRIVREHIQSDKFPYQGVIILVDDGSKDNSFEIARQAGADVLYRHVTNQGLGAATRSGMEIAHYVGCDAFAKFDADLQHDINDLCAAVTPLLENKADIVYASRFSGKIHYRMPFIRAMGNRFFTWLMRRITGWKISDAQTGMMCFSRRYLTVFEMPGTYNPPQQALFDAARKNMRYAEVPAQFRKRTTGRSFVSLKYIYSVLINLAKISFYYYCFSTFTILGVLLLLSGLVVIARGLYEYFAFNLASYAPNNTLIVFTMSTGLLSILFGLQSYAQINRMSFIRNGNNYRYIILEDIFIQSPEKIDIEARGPKVDKQRGLVLDGAQ